MAQDFFKFNLMNQLSARSRVLVLIIVIIGIIGLLYFGAEYLSNDRGRESASHIANAPQGLQSVPGGQLTPEYYRALVQANTQAAQRAQKTGASAISTLLNSGQLSGSTGGTSSSGSQCNIICPDEAANVKYSLEDWVKQGNLDPSVANRLQHLADSNLPVSEYSEALDQLVKEGKLTPAQARELLERYKKQHTNALLKDSAKAMDELIQSGQLPLEVANQLLAAQKQGMSTSDYAAKLEELVKQGKISPAVAQQLLAAYSKQHAHEIVSQSVSSLRQMQRKGQITLKVAQTLTDLENRMVPITTYEEALHHFIDANQLTPATAENILNEFRSQKTSMGAVSQSGTVMKLLHSAEQQAFGEISDLLKTGKIRQAVADKLIKLINQSVPLEAFRAVIDQLVGQNQLSPEIAKLKMADYTTVRQLRDLSTRLTTLQANNASPADYAESLKQAVREGVITPEQARQLLSEYQALHAATGGVVSGDIGGQNSLLTQEEGVASTEAFAKLRAQAANLQATNADLLAQGSIPGGAALMGEGEGGLFDRTLAQAMAKAQAEAASLRTQRMEALTSAMNEQAQQLVAAWQPTPMVHKEGITEETHVSAINKTGEGNPSTSPTAGTGTTGIALVKAGTILFAVLDTGVNSDYPDSPVMATIVSGKFKGAKVLGKLVTAKSPAGQQDRVALTFSLMNLDRWTTSKTINAFAIDPDTARSVMASQVNYHYLTRFGAMMGAAFLKGYANAITSSGETSTTGIFGTTSVHPELNPKQKIAVGLGEVGNALGDAVSGYAKIPPTVVVKSGVGLGILFMADLSE